MCVENHNESVASANGTGAENQRALVFHSEHGDSDRLHWVLQPAVQVAGDAAAGGRRRRGAEFEPGAEILERGKGHQVAGVWDLHDLHRHAVHLPGIPSGEHRVGVAERLVPHSADHGIQHLGFLGEIHDRNSRGEGDRKGDVGLCGAAFVVSNV